MKNHQSKIEKQLTELAPHGVELKELQNNIAAKESNMINFTFNFWDNFFVIISVCIGALVAYWIHKLSKQLSSRDRYEHEMRITREINKFKIYRGVILADVKKYHPLRINTANSGYYKQGAELYTVIPEYGIQFILRPSDKNIPVGLVPFEWIEYIREHDSEDSKPIIVCKFKGVRWVKYFLWLKHKSPFKEINYVYQNKNYKKGSDPKFLQYAVVKPD